MSRNKKKKKKKAKPVIVQPVFVPPPPPPKTGLFYRFFDKSWKIIAAIVLILGGIASWIAIREDFFKSDYQKFEEDETIQGSVKFPKISQSDPSQESSTENRSVDFKKRFIYNRDTYKYPEVKGIYIKNLENKKPDDEIGFLLDTNIFFISKGELDNGININLFGFICRNAPPLVAIAVKNRVYISAKFTDLRTGNEIGEMQFNHWKIYRHELGDYTPGEDRFEVKDKQGYIVFSIANVSSKNNVTIALSGYFNNPNSVLIFPTDRTVTSDCIEKSDSNWLKKAQTKIMNIKSVFPKK